MASFNMFGAQGFSMGGGQAAKPQAQAQAAQGMGGGMAGGAMGGGMPGGGAQAAFPTQAQEYQFYKALFGILDTEKKQALSGGQVFNFFLSSGVSRGVLADIWDLVKQNGTLVDRGFVTAMKLITLAQNGIPPEIKNLSTVQYVGPPRLQYPPNVRLLAPPGSIIKGAGVGGGAAPGGVVAAHQANGSVADPFSALNVGFRPTSATNGAAKPAGPTWAADPTANATAKSTATSSPQMNGLVGGSMGPLGGVGSQPASQSASVGSGALANQYAPSTMLKQMHVRQSTRTLANQNYGAAGGLGMGGVQASDPVESDNELPALGRVQSRRIFEDERTREELRASNQREKMARKNLNDARISNEKLERENEQLRSEIKESRGAQANALKQSSDALQQIQPLRLENEKLKQAISEWQDLITNKDNEFEELAGECDDLRAENEKFKNEARDAREKLDDVNYQLDSVKHKLDESESEYKKHVREISRLKDEKLKTESEKRDLDIDIVKLQSSVKSLQRELAKEKESKKRDSGMFSNFGNGFGPSSQGSSERRGRRSTTERPPSRTRSPPTRVQPASTTPVDVMLSGSGGGNGSGSGRNIGNPDTNSSSIDVKSSSKEDDLFAGLSHDTVPIPEDPPKSVGAIGGGDEFDAQSPDFPVYTDNNPPPPAGMDSDRIDIGNQSIAPPGVADITHADANLTGHDSERSEYDETEVEETVMEDYQVSEKQLVTVPKEVTYHEMGEVVIPVKPEDVTDGKYTGISTYGKSPYYLNLKVMQSNQGHFLKSDKDKDGKLNVKEAWAFFQMAKMESKVLQQAWKLVATSHSDPDLPTDGLAEIQFHCMFQIIFTMKRSGLSDCPNAIPDALDFDVIRMLGRPVNNGNCVIRKTIEKTRSEPAQEERIVKVTKQRPVKKMVKKRVKRKKGIKIVSPQPGSQQSPQPGTKAPNALPADDGFGFGDDDMAAPSNGNTNTNTNMNTNSNSNGGDDDWGTGFDDFGSSPTNDKQSDKQNDKKKDKQKGSDNFLADDDFDGTGGTGAGATAGAWENWGTDGW